QHNLRSLEESNTEGTGSGECDNGTVCPADTRCAVTDSTANSCRRSFPHSCVLAAHKPTDTAVCRKGDSQSDDPKQHITQTEQTSFKCDVCGKSFAQSGDLNQHTLIHTPLKCGLCGKTFSQSRHLSQHIFTHTGEERFECEICGKSFSQNRHLSRHMFSHTGKRPFKCEECGKSFARSEYLKKHFLTHTGEKLFKCEVCGKSFSQSGHLGSHIFTHTGEKRFKCDVCEKSFSHSGHLTRHILTHTGVKRFKCGECGKSFSQSENLKKHVLIHTGEKHFKCDVCGKSFSQGEYLKKHILIHTVLCLWLRVMSCCVMLGIYSASQTYFATWSRTCLTSSELPEAQITNFANIMKYFLNAHCQYEQKTPECAQVFVTESICALWNIAFYICILLLSVAAFMHLFNCYINGECKPEAQLRYCVSPNIRMIQEQNAHTEALEMLCAVFIQL
ncbi:hypothetical protein Cfor_12076, partial [Coptotermes formosanus]